jgi:molybdenum cofactor guanylyltransferase
VTEQRPLVAVLAGGLGSRLGGDKPAARLGGMPLLAYPLAAAREAGLPAIVVAKRDTPLPAVEAEILLEPEQPRHPLCGVLTALRGAGSTSAPAVIALACDMPFVGPELLLALAAIDGPALLRFDGRLQPLPARIPGSALASLTEALDARLSLREALAALQPRVIEQDELEGLGDPRQMCFNVNDAEDLRTAAGWLAEA